MESKKGDLPKEKASLQALKLLAVPKEIVLRYSPESVNCVEMLFKAREMRKLIVDMARR